MRARLIAYAGMMGWGRGVVSGVGLGWWKRRLKIEEMDDTNEEDGLLQSA